MPTNIFPALLGSVIAWTTFHEFYFWYFILVIIGTILIFVNCRAIVDGVKWSVSLYFRYPPLIPLTSSLVFPILNPGLLGEAI